MSGGADFDEISVIWGPELRFLGPKVCICMENVARIHLDTSRGLKPPSKIKKSQCWGLGVRAKILYINSRSTALGGPYLIYFLNVQSLSCGKRTLTQACES